MSSMERNKGTLVPYKGKVTEDMLEDPGEYELVGIHGKLYRPIYEVEQECDDVGFTYVTPRPDGRFDFHTHHYNGGAGLSEVIESAIDKDLI